MLILSTQRVHMLPFIIFCQLILPMDEGLLHLCYIHVMSDCEHYLAFSIWRLSGTWAGMNPAAQLAIIKQISEAFPVAQQQRICLQCRRRRRWGFDPWAGRIPWKRTCNPLQYSCLENPMDRGAWRATFHSIVQSWTWLKQPSSSSSL